MPNKLTAITLLKSSKSTKCAFFARSTRYSSALHHRIDVPSSFYDFGYGRHMGGVCRREHIAKGCLRALPIQKVPLYNVSMFATWQLSHLWNLKSIQKRLAHERN